MAGRATEKARQRIDEAANYGIAPAGAVSAVSPLASGYGVFGQQYAATLPTANPISGPLNDIALRHKAAQERSDYQLNLANAQEVQKRLATIAQKTELEKAVLANGPKSLDGERSVQTTADGGYGVIVDPVLQATNRTTQLAGDEAERYKTVAEAAKALRDAGVTVTPEAIAKRLTTPLATTPEAGYGLFEGNRTPDEQAKQTSADASMVSANADAVKAAKYRGGSESGGGEPTVSITLPGQDFLHPGPTVKGKASQMTQYMGGAGGAPAATGAMPPGIAAFQANGYDVQTSGSNYVVKSPKTGAVAIYNAAGVRQK